VSDNLCYVNSKLFFSTPFFEGNAYSYVGLKIKEGVQNRLSAVQERFLDAVKALAQVRKLLGPNLQVNTADKQINILDAGGDSPVEKR